MNASTAYSEFSEQQRDYLTALEAHWGAIGKAQADAGILHPHVQYWRKHSPEFGRAEDDVFETVGNKITQRLESGETVRQVQKEADLSVYELSWLFKKVPALAETVKQQEAVTPSDLRMNQMDYLFTLENNLGAAGKTALDVDISPSLVIHWRENAHFKDEEDKTYKRIAQNLKGRVEAGEDLQAILKEAGISFMELWTGLGRKEPGIRDYLHSKIPEAPVVDNGLTDSPQRYLVALEHLWGAVSTAADTAEIGHAALTRWRMKPSFRTAEAEAFSRIGERIITRLQKGETLAHIFKDTGITQLSLAQGMGRQNSDMYERIREMAPVLPHNARYNDKTRDYFIRTLKAQHGDFARTCEATGVSMHTLLYKWAHNYKIRMELNAAANEAAGRPLSEDVLMDMLMNAIMASSGLKGDVEQVLPRGQSRRR